MTTPTLDDQRGSPDMPDDDQPAPRRGRGRPPRNADEAVTTAGGRTRSPHDIWYPNTGFKWRLKWHAGRLATSKSALVNRAVGELLAVLDREAGVDTAKLYAEQPKEQS